MKRKEVALLGIFIVLSLIVYFFNEMLWASARDTSGCEKCHTNATVLKTLHKPPNAEGAAAAEEGEG